MLCTTASKKLNSLEVSPTWEVVRGGGPGPSSSQLDILHLEFRFQSLYIELREKYRLKK